MRSFLRYSTCLYPLGNPDLLVCNNARGHLSIFTYLVVMTRAMVCKNTNSSVGQIRMMSPTIHIFSGCKSVGGTLCRSLRLLNQSAQ